MKLRAVYADRFGSMRDAVLEGIGDGLTIILGPNESGKSTFANLVHQVLYGYPKTRQPGAVYKPVTGGREGRLLFRAQDGGWVVRRSEGPHGGPLDVQTLEGAARGIELVQQVVGSVTSDTYGVVFGFSLDEMAQIERGSDEAVVGRLYTGMSGGEVNPMQVRSTIESAARELFKKTGNSSIGALASAIRQERAAIADLERDAREYASDILELKAKAEQLDPLRSRRNELDLRLRSLDRDLQKAQQVFGDIATARSDMEDVARRAAAARARAESTPVNDALLDVAADIAVLLDQTAAIRVAVEAASSRNNEIEESRRKARELLGLPEGLEPAEARARLEEWRNASARLDADVQAAERQSDAARARLEAYTAAADRQRGAGATDNRTAKVAIALIVLGTLFAVAGLFARQVISLLMALFVMVAGVALFITGRRNAGATGISDQLAALEAEAESAERSAAAARERLTSAQGEWARWLSETGLGTRGDHPSAAAALLDEDRERKALLASAAALQAEQDRDASRVREWTDRLFTLISGPLSLNGSAADYDAIGLAARAREAVEQARAASAARDGARRETQAAEAELAELQRRADELERQLAEIGLRHGAQDDCREHLAGLIDAGQQELEAIKSQYELLWGEHERLDERLQRQARDESMAIARQKLEGLQEQAAADADAYLVEQLALHLVDEARANHQRTTQPHVVRVASEVFSAMTEGRYSDVIVPLGENEITVVGGDGVTVKRTVELSRGTAEQLYLALRVGLIESFGEQGPHLPVLMDDVTVNFDERRLRETSPALERLSRNRQVLFFTCHRRTAQTLFDAVPGAALVELGVCPL